MQRALSHFLLLSCSMLLVAGSWCSAAEGDADTEPDNDTPKTISGEQTAWALLDPDTDHVEGTRTERAYAELHLTAPAQPILVAVIDSGIDITHPDLADVIWTNPGEVGGKPGVDDDGNGYVDDLHGWNFIGNHDGSKQLIAGTMEVTREYARLRKLANTPNAPDDDTLANAESMYEKSRDEHQQELAGIMMRVGFADQALAILGSEGLKDLSTGGVRAWQATTPTGVLVQRMFLHLLPPRYSLDNMRKMLVDQRTSLDVQYGLDFDESAVIGDDPTRLDERGYGNPIIGSVGDDDLHGTHVAGIIGALRDNGIGAKGQCAWVRIISVRAVPDGDERDKDVANAVRYAVDAGARIINMSFGKPLSPDKAYVDAAFRYAEEKNVLIVHAAGNDNADTDGSDGFPNRRPLASASDAKPAEFANWIEVGASASTGDDALVAPFSNYGATTVDIFAPGVDIISTVPGGKVAPESGTSMASPEVAGVAALVLSQHPELTAVQLKRALMDNARRYPGLDVIKPGTDDETVPFASLSVSGGIVDAYLTLKALAAPQPQGEAKPDAPAKQ